LIKLKSAIWWTRKASMHCCWIEIAKYDCLRFRKNSIWWVMNVNSSPRWLDGAVFFVDRFTYSNFYVGGLVHETWNLITSSEISISSAHISNLLCLHNPSSLLGNHEGNKHLSKVLLSFVDMETCKRTYQVIYFTLPFTAKLIHVPLSALPPSVIFIFSFSCRLLSRL
jgi:hypothetical protein